MIQKQIFRYAAHSMLAIVICNATAHAATFDFGDAPEPFPTTIANNGARHAVGGAVYLGQCVDADIGNLQGDATADDVDVGDPIVGTCSNTTDEDGVNFGALIVGATIPVSIEASQTCKLNGWIDWNANNAWDTAEQVFNDTVLTGGNNSLTVTVPNDAVIGDVYARFRCSSAGGNAITGSAADGEIEDYKLTIQAGVPVVAALTLGNRIWNDSNANGIKESTEKGLANAEVSLLTADRQPAKNMAGKNVTPQTTNAAGYYQFSNLAAGEYIVKVIPPEDFYPTVGGIDPDSDSSDNDSNCRVSNDSIETFPVTLSANKEPDAVIDGDDANGNLTVDCGFYQSVAVGNHVWSDTNANGTQDTGEVGLSDITVQLLDEDGITIPTDVTNQQVASTKTDSNGQYLFQNLKPANYIIRFSPDSTGYSSAQGDTDVDSVVSDTDNNCKSVDTAFQTRAFALAAASEPDVALDGDNANINSTVDCGIYRTVSMGSKVWFDFNGDGKFDSNEVGLANVKVLLLKSDGTPATTMTGEAVPAQLTSAEGTYQFSQLPEGMYRIQIVPPASYKITNMAANASGAIISQPINLMWGMPLEETDLALITFGLNSLGVQPIPTLTEWGLILLSALFAFTAWSQRQRFKW